MLRRLLVVMGLAIGLGGCVTTKNTLSPEEVASYRLAGTVVRFAPDARIWWGDAERDFAVSKGLSPLASETVAETDEAKAYVRKAAAAKIRDAMDRNVGASLTGRRPVRLEVVVRSIDIASGAQRIILGGHHRMRADVGLLDATSGQMLLNSPDQAVQLQAGQGVLGVLVDNVLFKDPIDRLVQNYASQYSNWLLHK